MTVLSVTICLIILHFTAGLKVLPTGDQTNGTGTTELNDTTRQRVRRDAFAPVEPARGLEGSTVTVREESNVSFSCNPYQKNCPNCEGRSEDYAGFYFCEHPCKWGDVKAYAANYKWGNDKRFRVFTHHRLSNNRFGMTVEITQVRLSDQGKYYCGLDIEGKDWFEEIDIIVNEAVPTLKPFVAPELGQETRGEMAWMENGDTRGDQGNPEVQKAMMKCQGNKACALVMLQKEELEISTSCWLCLQMSHAWKAVPLTVATVNVTKCLIPQQMTDVFSAVADLENGRTPMKRPKENCDNVKRYNNTDIVIPPLRVTHEKGDVCICSDQQRLFTTGWSDCRVRVDIRPGTVNNCTATINDKETSFTCPFGKPYETSPAAVWVCGNKAFHSMPKHGWSGCCYPALINVGTSVYLPNKTRGGRAKRNVKILPGVLPNHYSGYTLSDPWTTPGANVGWSLFLGVGTTVTINKVNGLAWTVLAIANATENALSMINDEMRHLREAVIQNRLVLDLLTAEKGGVCKMLGVSCCFNIPDHSDNITDVIEHMRKAVQEPEPANDQWLTWIMNLEGGWGMWLAQTVLPIIVIVVLILLCIPCIIQCVSSLVQRLVKVGMSVQLVKMTVYPDDDVDVDDQQGDDASSGSYSERSN